MTTHPNTLKLATGTLLSGALLLAGCGNRDPQSPAPPSNSAPASAPASATEAAPTEASASAPKSRMTVSPSGGTLTVELNGRKVGDYPSYLQLDVTPYLKVGENTLNVSWTEPTGGTIKVEYALAATPDKYQDIASISLSSSDKKVPGSKKITFNLPNPDGSLPALETSSTPENTTPSEAMATGTPVSGSTELSDTSSNEGTLAPAANGAGTTSTPPPAVPEKPKAQVKAILVANSDKNTFEVFLNGVKVGDYQSYIKVDVGQYLRPGKNIMKVAWKGRDYLSAKIAVFAPEANDYRDAAKVALYSSDTRNAGQRTVSFNVAAP